MRFFRFPTAMVRPSSSLAKFSLVILSIPFPQFSSPPLQQLAPAALAPRESQLLRCHLGRPRDADPALSLCQEMPRRHRAPAPTMHGMPETAELRPLLEVLQT